MTRNRAPEISANSGSTRNVPASVADSETISSAESVPVTPAAERGEVAPSRRARAAADGAVQHVPEAEQQRQGGVRVERVVTERRAPGQYQ